MSSRMSRSRCTAAGGALTVQLPSLDSGDPCRVLVRLDVDECDRRVAAGLGAITSPDVLRVLLGLPLGEPVPRAALTVAERSALRAVSQGVGSFDDSCVIRHVVPPLEVALALVPARSWRSGLERAGRFAPFCPRAMVLGVPPRDLDDLYMETGFYGIGVIAAGSDAGPEVLASLPGSTGIGLRWLAGVSWRRCIARSVRRPG